MQWFETEKGKRRLLMIEIPAIERYNAHREEKFKIRLIKRDLSLVLRYRLAPLWGEYELETILKRGYPETSPETRVLTPLGRCPHMMLDQRPCLWRSSVIGRHADGWDPSKFTAVFAVQAAWRWLACYEVWLLDGEWPIPEA